MNNESTKELFLSAIRKRFLVLVSVLVMAVIIVGVYRSGYVIENLAADRVSRDVRFEVFWAMTVFFYVGGAVIILLILFRLRRLNYKYKIDRQHIRLIFPSGDEIVREWSNAKFILLQRGSLRIHFRDYKPVTIAFCGPFDIKFSEIWDILVIANLDQRVNRSEARLKLAIGLPLRIEAINRPDLG